MTRVNVWGVGIGLVLGAAAMSIGACADDGLVRETPRERAEVTEAAPVADDASVVDVARAEYQDGRYRGIFEDGGEQQVSIQFDLRDGVMSGVRFRHLQYRGVDYGALEEDDAFYPVLQQHRQIADYLNGRPLSAIDDVKSPGDIAEDIDGFTGATIRGAKIASALRDALNRDIYSPANGLVRSVPDAGNGRYRGVYGDGGEQQVSVQFSVANGTLTGISFRHLQYRGTDYRRLEQGDQLYPIVIQHQQITEYLEGRPLEAIFDLHTPGEFIDDVDGWTGATIRGAKVFSAMRDALNRGLYTPPNGFSTEIEGYADGRYRGTYGDGGEQQVSIQFHLNGGVIENVSFRHLAYRGTNYRALEEGDTLYPILTQHQQIADYLDGRPLSSIIDLHSPGDFVADIDGWTGATVRANKVYSAMRDALNRGTY